LIKDKMRARSEIEKSYTKTDTLILEAVLDIREMLLSKEKPLGKKKPRGRPKKKVENAKP